MSTAPQSEQSSVTLSCPIPFPCDLHFLCSAPLTFYRGAQRAVSEQPKPDKKTLVHSSHRRWITLQHKELHNHNVITFKYPSGYFKWSLIGQQRFSSSGWEHRELHITGKSRGTTWHLKQLLLQSKGGEEAPTTFIVIPW